MKKKSSLKDILSIAKIVKGSGVRLQIAGGRQFQLEHKTETGWNFGGQRRTSYGVQLTYPTGRIETLFCEGRTTLFWALTGERWKGGTTHSRKLKKRAAK